MNRILAVFLTLFLALPASAVDKSVTVPMHAVKLGAHSYFVQGLPGAVSAENQGFMSNAGFVVTPAGVVVFDALASPPLAEKLLGEIRKLTSLPIRRVIVSHYHADHFYGLQVFKAQGAEIWAHENAKGQTDSENAIARLAQRKEALFPWVDDDTRLVSADRYLSGDTDFELGGIHFQLRYVGPAHSAEDMAMMVKEDGVLYAGDLMFKGRIPYVGDADSGAWMHALEKLIALKPNVLVPGHGGASTEPEKDLTFTRDYLGYLRSEMGKAVADLVSFDEAYEKTDWSRYRNMPAFSEANRINAYNQYLLMEKESLAR